MALLLVAAMAVSFGACSRNGGQVEQILPDAEPALADPTVKEPAAVSAAERTDPDAPLAREEKELVAEVVGGVDAKQLSDKELDAEIDRLINEIDNTPSRPSGTTENTPSVDTSDKSGAYNDDGSMNQPFDEVYPELIEEEQVTFSGESILVKLADGTLTDGLKAAGIGALEEIVPMEDCAWYEAKLVEGAEPKTALAAVRALDEVLLAEYNYEIQVAAMGEAEYFDDEQEQEYEQNGRFTDQWYFHHCGIVSGFQTLEHPGGDPSVVVAVIDTGVDYGHEDLKGNIWVNTGEIPGNGIDDDGNGYIDDYYGVDIVSGEGNADDTNGHGTHVAGIIAARNNYTGVLGIAYNVKIMPIKAAAHNGTLSQGDIAKAVLYAYENGAEVINMSFGGSACSIAVQDALATAYSRCVLVASAGNDGAKNEGLFAIPNYPAALNYVLGVMSVDAQGRESTFTNWDVTKYNGIEYELYAPGEGILSTLPNDQYGYLSGTSMAAPVVSAFAAILRSEYPDRDKYPTRFIYGQLAATSDDYASCLNADSHGPHNLPQIANLHDALTKLPKPELNVQDYAIFDDPKYSANNNGDGVIDAGETIALGLTLRNRWGMSENTTVTLDTLSQTGIADPYITIQNPTVDYGSVGTYSTQDCGRVYTDGELTGWENPFLITVSEGCPNDYRFTLNVTIRCENALDETDGTTYTFKGTVNEAVRSGFVLPSIIEEDMTLTGDRLYIIPRPTVIRPGVTVTVEPGTHIQFWSNDPGDPYAEDGIAFLRVEGNFFVKGTKDDPVYLYPSELKSDYLLDLGEANGGLIRLEYADVTNLAQNSTNPSRTSGISNAYGCTFRQNDDELHSRQMSNGAVETYGVAAIDFNMTLAKNCVFYRLTGSLSSSGKAILRGTYDTCIFVDCAWTRNNVDLPTLRNNVFLGNSFVDQTRPQYVNNSTLTIPSVTWDPNMKIHYNNSTGTTYIECNSAAADNLLQYIRSQGGSYAVFETQEELDWLLTKLSSEYDDDNYESSEHDRYSYDVGITYDRSKENYVMADGSDLPDSLIQEGVTDGYHGNTLYLKKDGTLTTEEGTYGVYAVFELPPMVLPEKITFPSYRLLIDNQMTLQLTPLSEPEQLGAEDFLYESSNERVVTVDKTGLVTAVESGTADVWVYSLDRAVKNYVTIDVRDYLPLEGIAFPAEAAELAAGETLALDCEFTPADTPRRSLTYTSDHPEIAAVDADGIVTGRTSGTAVITATSTETGADGQPLTASVTVTVYQKAKSLALASEVFSVSVENGAADLPAAIADEGAELSLAWRSTDETVAAIENGKLLPKAAGMASVIATDTRSGLSAAVLVVVGENGAAGENTVSVTGSNLADSVLTGDTLTLSFSRALRAAAPQLYVEGSQTKPQSEIVDYNYLTVTLASGFSTGVVYELVFPANSLTAVGGGTNTEEIRITFTCVPAPSVTPDTSEPEEIHESQLDESVARVLTAEQLETEARAYLKEIQYYPYFNGNAILNPLTTDTDVSHWLRITTGTSGYTEIPLGGNWWGTTNESLIDRQIVDYADMPTYARLMYAPYLTEAPENTFPFVTDVTILNKDGDEIATVGNEKVTFRIRFNRDMDTSVPLHLTFGAAYPYADYEVSGSYVDARTWEGTYTVSTLIENGIEFFSISNGCSATDELDLQTDRHRFSFVIDTTAAQALVMQGNATDTGIELTWTQDDFTTLMGYNVYRSTAEDGLYTKLNKTVIPADTMTWFDDTVEPGVIYYYNFTVVQTDLSESIPSGKIVIMSKDTMAPNIYHSPVGNAFTGANLVLTATITDNLNIAYANLYYRVTGTTEWKTIRMNKLNDKYSAIIPASSVTLDGIEYYLEASDGVSSTFKGSAEEPFAVLVQEAIDENALGDVDGDGKITNLDAVMVLYAINDKLNLTPEQFARADLNGDGELWAAEALRILQYVSGVVGSLKM